MRTAADIATLYERGLSAEQIASEEGVSRSDILNILYDWFPPNSSERGWVKADMNW